MAKRIKPIQSELHDQVTNKLYRQDLLYHRRNFVLSSKLWSTLGNKLDKFKWPSVPFNKSSLTKNEMMKKDCVFLQLHPILLAH